MSHVLHIAGYYLAAALVATLPAAMLYWFLIHPLAAFWRRLGKTATFTIVGLVCVAVAAYLFSLRERLLAVHWGYHWALIALGLALYVLGVYGERRIRRQLEFRILVGTPELDAESPGALLTEGVYERSRNPRYVNLVVALFGWALVLNYPAVYVTLALSVPALYCIVLLEERELRARFAEPYAAYCRRVQRLLPRRGWIA